jgi:hypothetical protein
VGDDASYKLVSLAALIAAPIVLVWEDLKRLRSHLKKVPGQPGQT